MLADKRIDDIPEEVLESLARCILPTIQAYFESEEGQREFKEWKEKRGDEQTAAEAVKPE